MIISGWGHKLFKCAVIVYYKFIHLWTLLCMRFEELLSLSCRELLYVTTHRAKTTTATSTLCLWRYTDILTWDFKKLVSFCGRKKKCFWGFFISIDLLCEDKWKRGEMKRKNIVLKSFMNELWINLCIEPQYITHRTKSPVTNHQPTLPATNSQLLIYS